MKKIVSFSLALFLVFNFISSATVAQGLISGKVLNAQNSPVSGASVQVQGINGGAVSDIDGNYKISLPANFKSVTLVFTAVGYQKKEVSEIVFNGSLLENVDVVMEESSGDNLAEVVVQATSRRRESTNAMIQFQKNTNAVAQVVSAEAIKRSPDRNTGEVLKRTPGASVQEGKFLIVRGLADRYNQAMLNGVLLSSTEPDRKTFSFDIFPSNMIDNIIINKTFVPELSGEWAGGLVQVNTKDIPSNGFLEVQVGTGFNTQTIGKDFAYYPGGKLDFLGFDDGTRALANDFPSRAGFRALSDEQKLAWGKKVFADQWSYKNKTAPMNVSFQGSGGFNTRLFGKELGAIIGINYAKTNRILANNTRFYSVANNIPSLGMDYYNTKYNEDVNLGGLINLALKINNNNKITFKNLLSVIGNDYVNLRTGKDGELNTIDPENIRAREFSFKTNLLYNGQLLGEHSMGRQANPWKLKWYGAFANLHQNLPMQRRLVYRQPNNQGPYEFHGGGTKSQKSGSVLYSDLSDYIYNAGADITKQFRMFDLAQTMKAGYAYQYKDRLFNARPFSIYPPIGSSIDRTLSEDHFFAAQNFVSGVLEMEEFSTKQFKYTASNILHAPFIQFDNQLSNRLRAIWGVRYEYYDQLLKGYLNDEPSKVASVKGDFLPALNLVYKLNNLSNLRLAASQTVVRPEFRELSNFTFYDFDLGAVVMGNSNLKRTKISNLDLRYELYPRAGELFTFGVFYKNFDSPIEQILNASGVFTYSFNFNNAKGAKSYGAEFEFRKKLDMLEVLRNFTAFGNLSYINNKVTFEGSEIFERPMQGQSPYLVNLGLQFDLPDAGFSATTLFNQYGERIAYVGSSETGGIPNIYEKSRPLWDLIISQKVMKKKGEFKFTVSDILNRSALYYYDIKSDGGGYDPGNGDVIQINRNNGTNFSLSFSYKIK